MPVLANPHSTFTVPSMVTQVSALYAFTSFSFTSASLTGQTGPTRTQLLASYNTATNTWLNNTAYFNVVTQGIQQWTVPATGTYRLVLRGADGGGNTSYSSFFGYPGQGTTITCDVSLTASTVLNIVVGQTPTVAGANVGGTPGGGGTWIYTGTIGGGGLIAAAGGGGGWGHGNGPNLAGIGLGGSATTDSTRVAVSAVVTSVGSGISTNYTGNGTGATNGIGQGGGLATTGLYGSGAGGAGWLSVGTNTNGTAGAGGGQSGGYPSQGGQQWVGGTGGGVAGAGGFGGGGGSNGNGRGPGGGGGYTGGPAGNDWSGNFWGNGGGGGSFSTGTLVSATAGLNGIAYASVANGNVTITLL